MSRHYWIDLMVILVDVFEMLQFTMHLTCIHCHCMHFHNLHSNRSGHILNQCESFGQKSTKINAFWCFSWEKRSKIHWNWSKHRLFKKNCDAEEKNWRTLYMLNWQLVSPYRNSPSTFDHFIFSCSVIKCCQQILLPRHTH